MANPYANVTQATSKGMKGGYKPALYFAPSTSITTWGRPIASPVTPADKVKITTAHTFAATKTATFWQAKMHSVKHTSSPVGDEGAQDLEHTIEVKILGDDATIYGMVKDLLNDQVAIWIKDADCIANDSYVQLGDDCNPVTVIPNFDGKDTKEAGKKEYTIQFKSTSKFFYLAALDIAA